MSHERNRLTPEAALQKVKHFCAYQDRCHSEVKERLGEFGVWGSDADKILSQLIEENYLNEERFAAAFARGKFRMKQWGRVKITHQLKQKQVSAYCIRKGLTEIDDDEYLQTLDKLATTKVRSLSADKNIFSKKRKLTDYLLQKGYERDLIMQTVNKLL